MKTIDRITFDPEVMGGKPCIRGLRVTVGTLVGLIAAGRTRDEIIKLYPYLEAEDVAQALQNARSHPNPLRRHPARCPQTIHSGTFVGSLDLHPFHPDMPRNFGPIDPRLS